MWVTVAAAGSPLPFMFIKIIEDRGGATASSREHQLRGLKQQSEEEETGRRRKR
jgi:hypothetical protein